MKHLRLNRFAVAIGLAIGLALAVSGVAFAYVTATGTGTGTGRVGTASTTLTGKLAVRHQSLRDTHGGAAGGVADLYSVKNTTKGQVHFGTNTVALTTGTAHTTVVKARAGPSPAQVCLVHHFAHHPAVSGHADGRSHHDHQRGRDPEADNRDSDTGRLSRDEPRFTVHVPT